MTKKLGFSIWTLGLIFITSCTTYLIPVDSFKKQFSDIDSTKLKLVSVRGPFGEIYNYLANPIRRIKCEDKKGNLYDLTNSPSIEIRFTYGEKIKGLFITLIEFMSVTALLLVFNQDLFHQSEKHYP